MNEVLLVGKITEVEIRETYLKTFKIEVEDEGDINTLEVYLVGSNTPLLTNSNVIVKAKLIVTTSTKELCIVAKSIKYI